MHALALHIILQKKSTALHMAARHAHVAVLRILLEAQANTNLKDEVLNYIACNIIITYKHYSNDDFTEA